MEKRDGFVNGIVPDMPLDYIDIKFRKIYNLFMQMMFCI